MRRLAVMACVSGLAMATPALAQEARAPSPAESGVELRCSLSLRPWVIDPVSGERTRATGERYELRPVGEGAQVETAGDEFVVRAASMRLEYELVERATGRVVLHDSAELACGRDLTIDPRAIELSPGRVFFGATVTAGADDAGSCGGWGGPQQWYVVRLAGPARLSLRLVSEFDATLYVREGAIDGPEVTCGDRSARLETFDMNLPAGTYYVAVDGTRAFGRYRLVAFEDPVDPRALESAPHGELRPRDVVDRELVPAQSHYHASCGGTQAPEHLYAMRVDHSARFSFRLTSRFDSALYLLAENGDEIDCRSIVGWPGRLRRSRVSVDLEPGVYWVVVDGESAAAGQGEYRLSAVELPSPE